MNLLLDTHILIWWAMDDPKLSPTLKATLSDRQNDVYFSSISV